MPGRRGRTPFRNQVRDRRYQRIIEAAAAHPWGTRHELPLTFPDKPTARKHVNLIYAEGRYQGYSRKVHVTEHEDGTVTLAFQLWDKAAGQAYIAGKVSRGERLAYNTRRPRKRR